MAKQTENYWDKRALKRLSDSEKMSEEYIKRIKKIYDKAYKDIDREIASVYRNYSKETGLDVNKLKELLTRSETAKTWEQMQRQGLDKYIKNNYKARISRLEQIQAQIYAKAKQIYPKEELEHTMAYKGVINDSYYKAVYDTQMGTGYNFTFNKIDKNMLDSILNERWSGLNYSERVWGNTDILAQSLSEILGGAMLSGQSIEKTSKQVRERFDVSKYYAERLVRTETNHFNNMADAMAYEELGVDYYVFVATLDSRTSEKCQNMDGKKFAYKDKKEGINYPPLHPNCRSKTRGYVDEETENTLKRRARNPKTGKSELIDNISYKEWAKKNGLITKPKNNVKKSTKNTVDKPVLTVDNFPTTFKTGKEVKNTQILVDYINSRKNADPKVVKAYGLMGKMQNVNFKISHGKNYALSYNEGLYEPSNVKLTIPNIKDINDIPNINTVLHENMHLIDLMSGGYNNWYSSLNNNDLIKAVMTTNSKMSGKVRNLFADFNNNCLDIANQTKKKYIPLFNNLKEKYRNGLPYDTYKKEWVKIRNKMELETDNLQRSNMGGGVNNLQDIYDALSKGKFRDSKVVSYGHGSKYYSQFDNRVKEIVANYGTLSISRPDLIELLKADKPLLVEELDKYIEILLNKHGG
ncbi:minor capsid protein [bacterium]|nr:minor capsid protein [bacterium]